MAERLSLRCHVLLAATLVMVAVASALLVMRDQRILFLRGEILVSAVALTVASFALLDVNRALDAARRAGRRVLLQLLQRGLMLLQIAATATLLGCIALLLIGMKNPPQ